MLVLNDDDVSALLPIFPAILMAISRALTKVCRRYAFDLSEIPLEGSEIVEPDCLSDR
jgi:hypothetical protein